MAGTRTYYHYREDALVGEYDENGQPLIPNGPSGSSYVVRWRVQQVVAPGGNGTLPLSMLRITVRCQGMADLYRVVGDATLITFRTANIG